MSPIFGFDQVISNTVLLNPHPLLVPWSRKSRAIPLLPHGPYGLYRASVPVQGCTLLTVKPLEKYTLCLCVALHIHRHGVPVTFKLFTLWHTIEFYAAHERCLM